jgi:hypothetical protein
MKSHFLVRAFPTLLVLAGLGACGDRAGGTLVLEQKADTLTPEHPFLVVRAGDLEDLRARAATSPWREVALQAVITARNQEFDPTLGDFDAKTRMTDLCGALALAHALAPSQEWVTKLQDTLAFWPGFYLPAGDGVLVRWRQAAMSQSILALDVLHDALPPAELAALETMIDGMVQQWWENLDQDGTQSTPGIVALWALYTGRRSLAQEAIELYLARCEASFTPSGVYDSGPGYAWVRLGGERLSKYLLDDVLVDTGWVDDLRSDPRRATLHDWMSRGSFTPRRTNLTFGDSDPYRPIEGLLGYLQPYRTHLYSPRAARNAAWVVRDVRPRPLLSNYAVLDASSLTPEPPTSSLWGDAASFWEANATEDSLMGALWSARASGSHSHHDVNAVHLYAYGENVLRNSGYCGSNVGVDAVFDWDWIYSTAESSNTVTIAGTEHEERFGGGIVEGLLAPGFDYAAGAAGAALEIATHERSLLMVHGEPGLPGYFALFDEVTTDLPGSEVRVNLHPDSAVVSTLAPATEYEWTVNQFGPDDAFVALFLATPPAQAFLLDGGLCAFDDRQYVGKYLRARHLSDATGYANVLTLVVPHDASHAKPTLARLPGGALFSGASVTYPGGVQDFLIAAKSNAPLLAGQAFFQGNALHARFGPGGLQHYFVRRGTGFDDGAPQRTGFDSDVGVSLFVRALEARVTSVAGATITFHAPGLSGNTWSNSAGTVLSAGLGFVQLALNAGSFSFDLETGAELP